MTTFDEHSRGEVFRDYLNEARAAKDYAASGMDALPETADRLIGRGQIHATLAHAAATLLAAMPEPAQATHEDVLHRMAETIKALRRNDAAVKERDALRDRVDELVAAGLTLEQSEYPDNLESALGVEAAEHQRSLSHEPGTAPLCTCGHHQSQHHVTADDEWCTSCQDLCTYTPNTTEVDGWSEPAARGARFRVARFEQNGHVPPVYFKVTDQLGLVEPKEFPHEAPAQAMADDLNGVTSTGTDASVEAEAQSPAALDSTEPLVKAARDAMVRVGSPAGLTSNAQAAAAAVLRSLSERYSTADLTGLDALYRTSWLRTGKWLLKMATELEQHTDTPTTE